MNNITIEPICNVEPIAGISPCSNLKKTNEWRSCCLTVNSSALKYFVQVSILTSLIVYSASMLVIDTRCESQRNYGSLLMVCLGCFLPAPKMS